MNVRVEASAFETKASSVIVEPTVELSSGILIIAPVVTRFTLPSVVISVGGNSISAINPQVFKKEMMAVA